MENFEKEYNNIAIGDVVWIRQRNGGFFENKMIKIDNEKELSKIKSLKKFAIMSIHKPAGDDIHYKTVWERPYEGEPVIVRRCDIPEEERI